MNELRLIFLAQRNHNLRNCTETNFIDLVVRSEYRR
jgi:hypothetical protein